MKTIPAPRLPYAALLIALLTLPLAVLLAACQSGVPDRAAAPVPAPVVPERAVTRADLLGPWELLDIRSLEPGTFRDTIVQMGNMFMTRMRFRFAADSNLVWTDTHRSFMHRGGLDNFLGSPADSVKASKPHRYGRYALGTKNGSSYLRLTVFHQDDDSGRVSRRGDTLFFYEEPHHARARLVRVK